MLLLILGMRNGNGRNNVHLRKVMRKDRENTHLRKVEEDGETGQGRLGLWRGSVEAGEAGSAEVVGEDAVKCAAAGAHGGGSDLAQAHAVSPAGTVEDESGRN